MQHRSIVVAALLATLTLPVQADSMFLTDGKHSIALSGEPALIAPLGSMFKRNGFRKIDGLPDNRPSCLIGTESRSNADRYEAYCYKNDAYQGGMFTFAEKGSVTLLPDVLSILLRIVEGEAERDRFILAIPQNQNAQAVCIPDNGCIPYTVAEHYLGS